MQVVIDGSRTDQFSRRSAVGSQIGWWDRRSHILRRPQKVWRTDDLEPNPNRNYLFRGSDSDWGIAGGETAWRSIPGYLSVVGIENIWFSAMIVPALTTVEVPHKDVASFAFSALSGEKETEGDTRERTYEVPTELIIRESTAMKL